MAGGGWERDKKSQDVEKRHGVKIEMLGSPLKAVREGANNGSKVETTPNTIKGVGGPYRTA